MQNFRDYLEEATSPIDGEAKNALKDIQKRLDANEDEGVRFSAEAACKATDTFIKAAFR